MTDRIVWTGLVLLAVVATTLWAIHFARLIGPVLNYALLAYVELERSQS